MALYAFDGTWNEDEEAPEQDTHVVHFRDIYEGPVEYRTGVGTRFGAIGHALGGVLGLGGRSRIADMYEALRRNWRQGDRVIDIVGFSRGAALAVHFANVIGKGGIRLDEGRVEEPSIRFLGVWDIVGSFGLPIDFVIDFHEINIGWTIDRIPACVEHCFHAMALDERRQAFDVTRLNVGNRDPRIEEVWFRGVHSDVGGGNGNRARNNIALAWMLEKAHGCGLPIPKSAVTLAKAGGDPLAPIYESKDPIRDPRRMVQAGDHIHPTAEPKTLETGQSSSFPVRAAYKYNWSGVRLVRGARYRLEIPGDQRWMDASISCGPDGWRSEDLPWYQETVVGWFEDRRRLPSANWFELAGSLGDDGDAFFRIGHGGEDHIYTAPHDGDLYAFANDLDSRYGNNSGSLLVTVTRVA